MDDHDLLRADLNLLKLLKILGEEKNTKRTAERMFLSQPAISKNLKKLRDFLGDELFIRQQYGLQTTPYCDELLEKLPLVFDLLSEVFQAKNTFNAQKYSGEISIAINTSLYCSISKVLFHAFSAQSPNATFKIMNWGENTEADIQKGKIHMGINYYPLDVSKQLKQTKLMDVPFRICCHKDNPFVKSDRTLATLAQSPLALIIMPDFNSNLNRIEDLLLAHGLPFNIKVRSDQLSICFLAITELQAVMPIGDIFDLEMPEDVITVDVSDKSVEGKIGMFQSTRTSSTPLINWLSQLITQEIKNPL